MPTLGSLMNDIITMENAIEKKASLAKGNSATPSSAASASAFIDNLIKRAEAHGENCECEECQNKKKTEKENEKEGSMRNSDVMKIARAIKIAVLDNEHTQGSTVQVGPKSVDGAATNAAREQDQIIDGSSVESAADSNPERHNTSTSSDLIEGEPVNEKDMAKALKEGRLILMTDKEAAVLNKFASVGYDFVVDTYSDQIVNEKIAESQLAIQAAQAPVKIASAMMNTAANNDADVNAKLAALKQNDPALFAAYRTLAKRGLL